MSLCLASLLNKPKVAKMKPIFRGVFFHFFVLIKKKKIQPQKNFFLYTKYTIAEYKGADKISLIELIE